MPNAVDFLNPGNSKNLKKSKIKAFNGSFDAYMIGR
jgi:hypothetical protein